MLFSEIFYWEAEESLKKKKLYKASLIGVKEYLLEKRKKNS